MSNPFAAVAITKHGVEMVRNLAGQFQGTDVYYMSKFARGDEEELGYQLFEGSVKLILPDLFKRYNGIILFISLGAVVRMIAPILVDKKWIPPCWSLMTAERMSSVSCPAILAVRMN